ncbi:MAG TPA: RNA-binding domain-containing protein [Candidatus Dormibacteraeota bacterium]
MLAVLIATGLRATPLMELPRTAYRDGVVTFQRKGKRERVDLGPVAALIDDWLEVRPDLGSDLLFVTRLRAGMTGKTFRGSAVKRFLRAAGLPASTKSDQLRRPYSPNDPVWEALFRLVGQRDPAQSSRGQRSALLAHLLEQRHETANLDYKEPIPWADEHRFELIRDMIALANTRGGGHLVIGVRNSDLEPVGMPDRFISTYDRTAVHRQLSKFASPLPRYDTFPVDDRHGRRFIVVTVDEFDEVPIVCRATSPVGPKRVALREGGLYVRTEGGESVEISNEREMRAFLELVIEKAASHGEPTGLDRITDS